MRSLYMRYLLWKRVALMATLVSLWILVDAPKEAVYYLALGTVSVIFLGFSANILPQKLFRTKTIPLLLLLAGVLTGWILSSRYGIHVDKAYIIILLVVFAALLIDNWREGRESDVSLPFASGIVYSLGIYVYLLVR